MCLTSKLKFKEKFRYIKKGEACVSLQNHKFKNIEFCFIRVRHVPQLNNKNEVFISKFQIMKYIY